MAYNPLKPANDDFLASFPPEMREQLRAMINDQIVDALKLVGLSPGNASGNIPISNGTVNANLNADKLDGQDATAFAASGHGHTAATTSTNGFMSNTDKSKLDEIDPGAEVNQNAFSNIVVGETTIQADGKTDSLELVAGSKITLTPDAANDRVTIAFAGVADSDVSAPVNGVLAVGTVRSQLALLDTTQRTAKATPVDADLIGLNDSAASNALKKLTWANVKATLKIYFDTLYAKVSGGTFTGAVTVPSSFTVQKEGADGGQIVLEKGTASTLSGNIAIDQAADSVRFFEQGGTVRGAALPLNLQAAGANSEILTSTRLIAVLTGLDGTGSGVDADLLDGKHATEFVTAFGGLISANFNDMTPLTSHQYLMNSGQANAPSPDYGWLEVFNSPSATFLVQRFTALQSNVTWQRFRNNVGAWSAWVKSWNDYTAPSGIVRNVQQTIKTSTNVIGANSWSEIPDLRVTITPSSTASKILLTLCLGAMAGGFQQAVRLTHSGYPVGVSAASGLTMIIDDVGDHPIGTHTISVLLSPATTSPITFYPQCVRGNNATGELYVNRNGSNSLDYISTITAMEVL